MELFYNKYGQDGPPLVILHGLLGANGNWHTLSRTRFQDVATVYAVDQRNHGRSPHTDRMDYPSMAADVKRFAENHDLSSVTLLGHSMGGKTAMEAALSYPDLVDRLIVVDMAPKAYPPHHEDLLAALARIDPSEYEDREQIDDTLADDVPSWAIRQFLLKNLKYDGEEYEWTMNLEAIRTHYDKINAEIPSDRSYHGPTLFIRGEESGYVSDSDWPGIRDRFPTADLATVDGAGHWVHADAPTPFADIVVDFLSEG
ncbi:alpha/beta hydrolase [Salinibacter sp. 10B]|uniref:alpha/beta fold hydrolase n=1 Tax=Salinibacter sp. 10B TaxID=1923971 RepID=UPI000CF47D17|nr:alpha/beta fold hydrolase [Salinibacter sp. 10B]PQJ36121.1 alpha/beta hydrolase [Salinibacter sp. 10B]